uniref:AlNc14C83G5383 protein n=1 Tax=Albugo laibachii Nc14 TaxID=890382 RepID=F0WFJ8_9STRA|nr:AlNc14C83G5383 [Albugo laibachii Nc14]|eukprot:CCA19980.1 AlNc14C83G5383 [Albugo laibachii Nc14]
MSTALDVNVSNLKEERWSSGKEVVDAVKLLTFKQSKCATVHTRGGMFCKLVCTSAETGCTWFVNIARTRKGGVGDWHVTSASLSHIYCLGRAKPTRQQLISHPVIRSTLAANPSSAARELITQFRHQNGITASSSTMYRAKETVATEMFSEDPTTVQLLPSYLKEFQRLNPGTFTALECYKTGNFRWAIMVMNPKWFLKGQGVYGVDAARMKHRRCNDIKIILVGRDGNFSNQVAAVALAPVKDFDNYAWFLGSVVSHGFPPKSSPAFSDRNIGLISVVTSLAIFNMHYVRHIIGTCNIVLCFFTI